jgi:hypothetical protein
MNASPSASLNPPIPAERFLAGYFGEKPCISEIKTPGDERISKCFRHIPRAVLATQAERAGGEFGSQSSQQQQYKKDDQNQSEPAARVVAPATAVRPGGQSAYNQQQQNDQQKYHSSFLLGGMAAS